MHEIIKHPVETPNCELAKVFVSADRGMLAKRRWHVICGEIDFDFDLAAPLVDGDVIFETETLQYVMQQKHEPVLKISLGEPEMAARRAWSLGNLHFPIEVRPDSLRVPDDPAVRIYLEREQIAFEVIEDIFRPMRTVTSHSHGHAHAH